MGAEIQRSNRVLNASLILVWIANGILGTFLSVYVLELRGSLFEVSMVTVIPNLSALVTSALWGGLSDRLNNRKHFITIGNAALGATTLLFVLPHSAVQLLSIYGIGSVFIAATAPALSAYVTLTSASSGRSLGVLLGVQSVGWAIGSLFGGFLYQAGQIIQVFEIGAAATFLGTAIFALWFIDYAPGSGDQTFRLSLKDYLRVQRLKGVLPACVVGFVLMVGNNAFFALFGVYLADILGGGKILLGESMALSALLGAVVSPVAGRLNDHIGRKPVLILGCVIYSAFFLAVSLFSNPLVVAILWILPIYPLIYTSLSALISDFTSGTERGMGMGLLNTSLSLGRVVGPLLGGIIASFLPIEDVAFFALLLGAASTVYAVLFIVEGRRFGP